MNILDLKITKSDAGNNITIRQYLKKLLTTLWVEEEGFSGKRPFGNSGWQYAVYKPLIKAKLIKGAIDKDGFISDVDTEAADKLILKAIEDL